MTYALILLTAVQLVTITRYSNAIDRLQRYIDELQDRELFAESRIALGILVAELEVQKQRIELFGSGLGALWATVLL